MGKSVLVENKRWSMDSKQQDLSQNKDNNNRPREDYNNNRPREDYNNNRPREDYNNNRPREDYNNRPREDYNNNRPRQDYNNRPRQDYNNRPRQDYNNRPREDYNNNRPRQDYNNNRPRQDYNNRSVSCVKNIMNENVDNFPILCKSNDPIPEVSNLYLEKIKKQKEKDDVSIKMKLKPGWISYKLEKGKMNTTVSRDGINYYPTIRETYTDEELEKKEKDDFNEEMKLFSYRVNELYLKRKKESDNYYHDTGELDSFAIAEIEALEYEEYSKKFEDNEEDIIDSESEDEEDILNSDNEETYKKR